MAENTQKKQNKVAIVSFLKFAKKISEKFYTGQITLVVEEDGVKHYANISVNSNIDLTEFNDKRVQIIGFFTGNMYKGKTSLQIRITSIAEKPSGKGSSYVILTTRTSFVKEGFGNFHWTRASGSVKFNAGTKDAPNPQYVNIDIKGNKNELALKNSEIVTVKGFLVAEHIPVYGKREAFTKPAIVGMEILDRSGEGEAPEQVSSNVQEATAETPTKEATAETPTKEATAETISDEEIPF